MKNTHSRFCHGGKAPSLGETVFDHGMFKIPAFEFGRLGKGADATKTGFWKTRDDTILRCSMMKVSEPS